MTPTEQDKELREKVATIVEYWDFSPLQDEDSRIERLKNEIMQLILTDRKKHELQARIDEIASVYIYHPRMAVGVLKTDRPMGEITVLQRIDELVAELKQELEKL